MSWPEYFVESIILALESLCFSVFLFENSNHKKKHGRFSTSWSYKKNIGVKYQSHRKLQHLNDLSGLRN